MFYVIEFTGGEDFHYAAETESYKEALAAYEALDEDYCPMTTDNYKSMYSCPSDRAFEYHQPHMVWEEDEAYYVDYGGFVINDEAELMFSEP